MRPLSLTIEACEAAIADAGLTFDDIDGLSTYPGLDIAGMGGDAQRSARTRSRLDRAGLVVTPALARILVAHMNFDSGQPIVKAGEAMAQLRSILTSREALYEQAHAQLDTSGQSVPASLEALTALIAERGFLDS